MAQIAAVSGSGLLTPVQPIGILTKAAVGAFVATASFYLTLVLTEPTASRGPPSMADLMSTVAGWKVSNYSPLADVASEAGWRLSKEMAGNVDGLRRVSEDNVAIAGWLANPQGDETPRHVAIFVANELVATVQTKGPRPDVTLALGLAFGAEKNVQFQSEFRCRTGEQPVVVGLDPRQQYLPLNTNPCP